MVEQMSSPDLLGLTVSEAISYQNHYPAEIARSALMHVLWRQRFNVDLARPLAGGHVLGSPV
jgi:hypothetical protein